MSNLRWKYLIVGLLLIIPAVMGFIHFGVGAITTIYASNGYVGSSLFVLTVCLSLGLLGLVYFTVGTNFRPENKNIRRSYYLSATTLIMLVIIIALFYWVTLLSKISMQYNNMSTGFGLTILLGFSLIAPSITIILAAIFCLFGMFEKKSEV